MYTLLQNIINYRSAFSTLVMVEIKTTVSSSKLGWVWWLLDPFILMCIYYFVISIVFQRGGENYHLFVLCGIVIWQLFSRSVGAGTKAIVQSGNLIKQIGFPVSLLVLTTTVVQLFFALFGIAMVSIWSYETISSTIFLIFPILFLVFLLAYVVSIFTSILQVFYGDTAKFIGYVLRAGFFLTPVLYPASRVLESTSLPKIFIEIYSLNPMAWCITAARSVVLSGSFYNWTDFFILFVITVCFIQLGLFILSKLESRLIKFL